MRQTKLDEYSAFQKIARFFHFESLRLKEKYEKAHEEIEDEERRSRTETF